MVFWRASIIPTIISFLLIIATPLKNSCTMVSITGSDVESSLRFTSLSTICQMDRIISRGIAAVVTTTKNARQIFLIFSETAHRELFRFYMHASCGEIAGMRSERKSHVRLPWRWRPKSRFRWNLEFFLNIWIRKAIQRRATMDWWRAVFMTISVDDNCSLNINFIWKISSLPSTVSALSEGSFPFTLTTNNFCLSMFQFASCQIAQQCQILISAVSFLSNRSSTTELRFVSRGCWIAINIP